MARGRGRGGSTAGGNIKRGRFGGRREPHHHPQHRHGDRRQQQQHATTSSSTTGTGGSTLLSTSSTSITTVSHHNRPRRGPPAIFVTCEAGREHKCKREALELLHHYYYATRGANNDNDEKMKALPTTTDTTTTNSTSTLAPSLSLEEELAMLRKGAAAEEVLSYQPNSKRPRYNGADEGGTDDDIVGGSSGSSASMKSPFAIYDTGMRGMICILCTLPQCEYIPYDEILMQLRNTKENDNTSSGKGGDGQAPTTSEAAVVDEGQVQSSSIQPECTNDDQNDYEVVAGENQNIIDSIPTSPILWDPVQTVKCILNDAKRKRMSDDDRDEGTRDKSTTISNIESSADATSSDPTVASPPGSRFISRILPMQATCYASIDEIKAVSLSLLTRCLPDIIQSKSRADNKSSTTNNITFKLEVKRRLCTHLTRDGVIEAVTPLILGGQVVGLKSGCTFSVNLTNPDFSLRIETCKALCGISILPREDWYGNFNLAEINDPRRKSNNNN